MSKARLVITAITVENRAVAEVVADYGVSRSWVYELLARYRLEGEAAFAPRSRRPKTSPTVTPQATVELVLRLRKQLSESGLDAGADTIGWHLNRHHGIALSRSTINRVLTRAGAPDPKKRPKSSYIRFQAELPNQCWQSDFTHYRLSDGTDAEIITWLDDHSRHALHISAHTRITADIVAGSLHETASHHGYPASTLTDNGMVYTARLANPRARGGRTKLEAELRRLNIKQKNSAPGHPTTCGKVERFQQTMKKWLAAQPKQPTTIAELQTLINTFATEYNHRRPHRSLAHQATPATAYQAGPKPPPPPAEATKPTTASDTTASMPTANSLCA